MCTLPAMLMLLRMTWQGSLRVMEQSRSHVQLFGVERACGLPPLESRHGRGCRTPKGIVPQLRASEETGFLKLL